MGDVGFDPAGGPRSSPLRRPWAPCACGLRANVYVYMGGCHNYGPFLGIHIKGDIDVDVDRWLSKLWSFFWVFSVIRHLVFRGPQCTKTPQCSPMKGLIVSIRWYLGCLKGCLGGAGICLHLLLYLHLYPLVLMMFIYVYFYVYTYILICSCTYEL